MDELVAQVNHEDPPPHQRSNVGWVEVIAGSTLAKIIGAGRVEVNSLHHQTVATLGTDVREVAHGDDGVVEAVEVDQCNGTRNFCAIGTNTSRSSKHWCRLRAARVDAFRGSNICCSRWVAWTRRDLDEHAEFVQ